jgi:uncharacterized membrane protein
MVMLPPVMLPPVILPAIVMLSWANTGVTVTRPIIATMLNAATIAIATNNIFVFIVLMSDKVEYKNLPSKTFYYRYIRSDVI